MAGEIFEYRKIDYVALKSTDDLMDAFTSRVDWLISCLRDCRESSSVMLARSAFRYARELEHRGVRVNDWKSRPNIGGLTGDDMDALRAAIDDPNHVGI